MKIDLAENSTVSLCINLNGLAAGKLKSFIALGVYSPISLFNAATVNW